MSTLKCEIGSYFFFSTAAFLNTSVDPPFKESTDHGPTNFLIVFLADHHADTVNSPIKAQCSEAAHECAFI